MILTKILNYLRTFFSKVIGGGRLYMKRENVGIKETRSDKEKKAPDQFYYISEKDNQIRVSSADDLEHSDDRIRKLYEYDQLIQDLEMKKWSLVNSKSYYNRMTKQYQERYQKLGFTENEINDIIVRILEDR
jgi:hypothetical protein